MLVNLVFDGHARNVANLPLDVFVSFSVACLTEFPADVFLVLTLDRWGRRWLAFATMILSGTQFIKATREPLAVGPYQNPGQLCGMLLALPLHY